MAETDNKPELCKTISREKFANSKKSKTLPRSEFVLRKKKFLKFNRRGDRNVYVNNKTNLKAQLHKCEKLFDKGASELIIHGLGAAICKATTLALQLRENHHGCLDLDVKTSTVILEEVLESLNDDLDDEVNSRQNSAVHIRVFRKIPVTKLRIAN